MRIDSWQKLIEYNIQAPQNLQRTPEPSSVTDEEKSVAEYNQVMTTNLTVNYSVCLDLIHRSRNNEMKERALDLCSGPGHFSMCLKKYLGFHHVQGVDLSAPMVATANRNAHSKNFQNQIQFSIGDVTRLDSYGKQEFDLVTFTNSAHHFDSLKSVEKVLSQAERVVRPEGLIFVSDLGRLKDDKSTEAFVKLAGSEFLDRGMNSMYTDFHNSMYAAWLPEELAQAVPSKSKRVWFHVIPQGISSFQALIGLPEGRETLFLRPSQAWEKTDIHASAESKNDWLVYRGIIESADIRCYKPQIQKVA